MLNVWLKTPPAEAILFTRLSIVESLIMAISLPLTTLARAPGKIALYESTLGSIQIGVFLVSWWLMFLGYSAEWVFYIAIIANLIMFKIRLLIVRYLTGLEIILYYKKVVFPVVIVMIISGFSNLFLSVNFSSNIYFSLVLMPCYALISLMTIWFLGLDYKWREKIKHYLVSKFLKSVEV
ncbi:hypothetical protein P4S70_20285 [Enterovibrio sp. Hal110]